MRRKNTHLSISSELVKLSESFSKNIPVVDREGFLDPYTIDVIEKSSTAYRQLFLHSPIVLLERISRKTLQRLTERNHNVENPTTENLGRLCDIKEERSLDQAVKSEELVMPPPTYIPPYCVKWGDYRKHWKSRHSSRSPSPSLAISRPRSTTTTTPSTSDANTSPRETSSRNAMLTNVVGPDHDTRFEERCHGQTKRLRQDARRDVRREHKNKYLIPLVSTNAQLQVGNDVQHKDPSDKSKSQKDPCDNMRISSDQLDKRDLDKSVSDGSSKLPKQRQDDAFVSPAGNVIGKHGASSKSNESQPVQHRLSADKLEEGRSKRKPSDGSHKSRSVCLPTEPERQSSHNDSSDSRSKFKQNSLEKNRCGEAANSVKATVDVANKHKRLQSDETLNSVSSNVQNLSSGKTPTPTVDINLARGQDVSSDSNSCKRRPSMDGPDVCHKKIKMSSPAKPVTNPNGSSSQLSSRGVELHVDRKQKKVYHNFKNETTAVCPERRFSVDSHTSVGLEKKDKSIRRHSNTIRPSVSPAKKHKPPSRQEQLFKPDVTIRIVKAADKEVCATPITKDSQPTEHNISSSFPETKSKPLDETDKRNRETAINRDSQQLLSKQNIPRSKLEVNYKRSTKSDKTKPVSVPNIENCRITSTKDSHPAKQETSRLSLELNNNTSNKSDKSRPVNVSDSRPVSVSEMERCTTITTKEGKVAEQKMPCSNPKAKNELHEKSDKIRSVTETAEKVRCTTITKDLTKQKVMHSSPAPKDELSPETAAPPPAPTEKPMRREEKSKKDGKDKGERKETHVSKSSYRSNAVVVPSKESSAKVGEVERSSNGGQAGKQKHSKANAVVVPSKESSAKVGEVERRSSNDGQPGKQKHSKANAVVVPSKESSAKVGEVERRSSNDGQPGKQKDSKANAVVVPSKESSAKVGEVERSSNGGQAGKQKHSKANAVVVPSKESSAKVGEVERSSNGGQPGKQKDSKANAVVVPSKESSAKVGEVERRSSNDGQPGKQKDSKANAVVVPSKESSAKVGEVERSSNGGQAGKQKDSKANAVVVPSNESSSKVGEVERSSNGCQAGKQKHSKANAVVVPSKESSAKVGEVERRSSNDGQPGKQKDSKANAVVVPSKESSAKVGEVERSSNDGQAGKQKHSKANAVVVPSKESSAKVGEVERRSSNDGQPGKQKDSKAYNVKYSNTVPSKESSAKIGEEEPRKKQPEKLGNSNDGKGKEERRSENLNSHRPNKEKGRMEGEVVKHDSRKRKRNLKENKYCLTTPSHKKSKRSHEHATHSSTNVLTTNANEALASAETTSSRTRELIRSLIPSPKHRKSSEDSNVMNLEYRRDETSGDVNQVVANVCFETDFDNNIINMLETYVDKPVSSGSLECAAANLPVDHLGKNTGSDRTPKISSSKVSNVPTSKETSRSTTSNTLQVPNRPPDSLDISAYIKAYTNPPLLSPIPSPELSLLCRIPNVNVLHPISQERRPNPVEVPANKATNISKESVTREHLLQEEAVQTRPVAEPIVETSLQMEFTTRVSPAAKSATSPEAESTIQMTPMSEKAIETSPRAESAVEASAMEKSSLSGLQDELVDDHHQTVEVDDPIEYSLMLPSPPVPYDTFMEPEYFNCSLNIGSPFPMQLNTLHESVNANGNPPVAVPEQDAVASSDATVQDDRVDTVPCGSEAIALTSALASKVVSAVQSGGKHPNVPRDETTYVARANMSSGTAPNVLRGEPTSVAQANMASGSVPNVLRDETTSVAQANMSNGAEGNQPVQVPPQALWGKIRCKDPKCLLIATSQNIPTAKPTPPHPSKDVSSSHVGRPKGSVDHNRSVLSKDLRVQPIVAQQTVAQPINQQSSMPSVVAAAGRVPLHERRTKGRRPNAVAAQPVNRHPSMPSLASHSTSPESNSDLRKIAILVVLTNRMLCEIRKDPTKKNIITENYASNYLTGATKISMRKLYVDYINNFNMDYFKTKIYEITEVQHALGPMDYPFNALDSYILLIIGDLQIERFLQSNLGNNLTTTQHEHQTIIPLDVNRYQQNIQHNSTNRTYPVPVRNCYQQSIQNNSTNQSFPVPENNHYQPIVQLNSMNQTYIVPVNSQYQRSGQQASVNLTYSAPVNNRYQQGVQQTSVNQAYPTPVTSQYQQRVQQSSVNQTYPTPVNSQYQQSAQHNSTNQSCRAPANNLYQQSVQQTSANQVNPGRPYQQNVQQHSSMTQIYPATINSQYQQTQQQQAYPVLARNQYHSTVQSTSTVSQTYVPVNGQNFPTRSSQLQAENESIAHLINPLDNQMSYISQRSLYNHYNTRILTATGNVQSVDTRHSLAAPSAYNSSNQSQQVQQTAFTNVQQQPTPQQEYSSLAQLQPSSQVFNLPLPFNVPGSGGSVNVATRRANYNLGELSANASGLRPILQPTSGETVNNSRPLRQYPPASTSLPTKPTITRQPPVIPAKERSPRVGASVVQETAATRSLHRTSVAQQTAATASSRRTSIAQETTTNRSPHHTSVPQEAAPTTSSYPHAQQSFEHLLCPDAIPRFANDQLDLMAKAVNSGIGKMPPLIPIPENFVPPQFSQISCYQPANETPSTSNEPESSTNAPVAMRQTPLDVGWTVEAVSPTANHITTNLRTGTARSELVAQATSGPTSVLPDGNRTGVPAAPRAQTEADPRWARAETIRILSPHTEIADDFQSASRVAYFRVSPHVDVPVPASSPRKEPVQVRLVSPHVSIPATSPRKDTEQGPLVSPHVSIPASSPRKDTEQGPLVSPHVSIPASSPRNETEQVRLVSPHVSIPATSPRNETEHGQLISPHVEAGVHSKQMTSKRASISHSAKITTNSSQPQVKEASMHEELLAAAQLLEDMEAAKKLLSEEMGNSSSEGEPAAKVQESSSGVVAESEPSSNRVQSSLAFTPKTVKSETGVPFVVIPADIIANMPAYRGEEVTPADDPVCSLVTQPATDGLAPTSPESSPTEECPKESKSVVPTPQKPPTFTEDPPETRSEHTTPSENEFETSADKTASVKNCTSGYTVERCPLIANKMHAYRMAKRKVKKSPKEVDENCTYQAISKELHYNRVVKVPQRFLEEDDDEDEDETEEDSQRLVIDLEDDDSRQDLGFYPADEEPCAQLPARTGERSVRALSTDSGFPGGGSPASTCSDPTPCDLHSNCNYCLLGMVGNVAHPCSHCNSIWYCTTNCRDKDWVLKHHGDCLNAPC